MSHSGIEEVKKKKKMMMMRIREQESTETHGCYKEEDWKSERVSE